MTSRIGTQTSPRWMIRTGWIMTWFVGGQFLIDGLGKALVPSVIVGEVHRLGLTETSIRPFAVLYLACTVLYLIPRTVVLGAILLTGYLGGAEAIQLRVADSGLVLQMLPVFCGLLVWGGAWLRDERLRNLIPLRAHIG